VLGVYVRQPIGRDHSHDQANCHGQMRR
jgi:hypothetical protein